MIGIDGGQFGKSSLAGKVFDEAITQKVRYEINALSLWGCFLSDAFFT
ncbi:MAG: hypothetical protein ACKO5Q_23895 [Microcystaceae cyanobacterium]